MSTNVERARPASIAGNGRQRAPGSSAHADRGLTERQVVIGLTLLALALRLATLNVQSVWLDESATMVLVRRGFWGMLSHLSASESTPPLYYVLVWAWTKLFGTGVLGFRSLSVLIGTLTVPAMYAAGRHVSRRTAFWAATLTVVSPAMYYYSQEARCYALLVLFSAVAFVFWQRALEEPDRRNLALWSAASAAALLTHYFAVFIFIPELVLLAWRIGARRMLIPTGAVALVGVALIPLARSQLSAPSSKVGWIEETSLASRITETGKELVVGVYGPLELISALLAVLLVVAAIVLLLRHAQTRERMIARNATVVFLAAIAIPLLPAAAHLLDVFDGRNVITAWIPFVLVIAIGVGGERSGRAGTIVGTGLCVISLAVIAGINLLPAYQRDDWRGAARALSPSPAPGGVLIAESNSFTPLSIYLPDLGLKIHPATVRTRELDVIALRTRGSFGGPPSAPVPQAQPLPGFRLVALHTTSAFTVSRFIASTPLRVTTKTLRLWDHDPYAEVMIEQ